MEPTLGVQAAGRGMEIGDPALHLNSVQGYSHLALQSLSPTVLSLLPTSASPVGVTSEKTLLSIKKVSNTQCFKAPERHCVQQEKRHRQRRVAYSDTPGGGLWNQSRANGVE